MAYFIPKENEGAVNCYDGTTCSKQSPAELTNPVFIAKAQANPDFTEVVKVPKEEPKPVKKKAAKKRAKKKVSRKK